MSREVFRWFTFDIAAMTGVAESRTYYRGDDATYSREEFEADKTALGRTAGSLGLTLEQAFIRDEVIGRLATGSVLPSVHSRLRAAVSAVTVFAEALQPELRRCFAGGLDAVASSNDSDFVCGAIEAFERKYGDLGRAVPDERAVLVRDWGSYKKFAGTDKWQMWERQHARVFASAAAASRERERRWWLSSFSVMRYVDAPERFLRVEQAA